MPTATAARNTQYAHSGARVEVDQPRQVGGGEVGEHGEGGEGDQTRGPAGHAVGGRQRRSTHSTACSTTKVSATGATIRSR